LRWEARVTFREVVRIMVDAGMEALGLKPPGEGQKVRSKYGMNSVDRALINPAAKGMET